MNPDQVLEGLSKIDVAITRRTLLNYENGGLIAKATRGGGGPGGRFSLYPEGTIEEAYAAWALLHGEYGQDREKEFFGGTMPKIAPQAVAFTRAMIIHFIRRYHRGEKNINLLSILGSQENIDRLSVLSTRGNVVPKGAFDFNWILGEVDAEAWLRKKWVACFVRAAIKLGK